MARDARDATAFLRSARASVTLVALCLMTALGIALGSYLALCARSAQLSARTVSGEQAQQLAQTGLEEALWALNQDTWTTSGPEGNMAWTTNGANRTVTLSYPLPSPNGTGQIVLTVADYASTGPKTWPTITSAATITLPSGQVFTKTFRATTTTAPLFGNAIASSESSVSFAGSGSVDSWNSDPDNDPATPSVSYATSIATPTASNYNAVVAGRADGNGTNGVDLKNVDVHGYVATTGLPVTYSSSSSARIQGLTSPSDVKIDENRIGKSAFVPGSSVFTISPPTSFASGGLFADLAALVNSLNLVTLGSTSSFKTTTNYTVNGGLLGAANITISGHVKFVIDGDFTITTGISVPLLPSTRGKITIQPGASLELFVNGDITISADGFDNKTGDPKNLAIYCTATGTTPAVIYDSTSPFCGVIYSENRPISIKHNGPFYGALLSRQSISFISGSPEFHYDVALRQARFSGVKTPYLLKRVTEL